MNNNPGKPTHFGPIQELQRRKKVRLLVVGDDSQDKFDPYYSGLKECAELCAHIYDITCNFTTSGEKAVELLETWEPTVLLVDAHLHDMNCLDLVKHSCAGHVPVVVTSDHPSPEIAQSAKEQGAAAYIAKTENPDEFEMLLQRIVTLAGEASIKH